MSSKDSKKDDKKDSKKPELPKGPPVPGNPYIGAHITLLSKAEIRYEGTLYSIDMEGATITLQTGAFYTCMYHMILMYKKKT